MPRAACAACQKPIRSQNLAHACASGARGVRIALQGHMPIMAGVQAVYNTLKALRDGVPPKDLKGVAGKELMDQVTRAADYKAQSSDWLKSS